MSTKPNGKKKKRSFYQRTKKFGQQGSYGKGRMLSKEEYLHFVWVLEALRNMEGPEKDSLIKSILLDMVEQEKVKDLATNQIVSKILDDILPLAFVEDVLPVLKGFSEDLRVMCVDPFASHVLQTLLTLGLKYIQKDAKHKNVDTSGDADALIPLDDDQKEDFNSFISKTSKFVYNNLEDFMHETYASHILRTILEVCSGVQVKSSIRSSNKGQTMHSIKENEKQVLFVPESLTLIWVDILDRIKHLPNFIDVVNSECGSAVLQTALLTLSAKEDTERISGLASHIIEHGFFQLKNSESNVHPLFDCNAACRLMEVVVAVVSEKQQELLYNTFFKDTMAKLVRHPLGNFAVQKLFLSWKSKELLPTLHESHSECLEEAFSCGNNGVLYSFVHACRRLNSCQSRCLKTLMKVFECFEPEGSQVMIAPLLFYFLKLKDYEANQDRSQTSLHGTLIIQDLLHFNKPIKVIKSILEMPSSELVKLFMDTRGTHVTDAFMASPVVGEASRAKLISKLEGNYVTMACTKHGSFSLENIFNNSNVKVKTSICQELFENSDKLKGNKFGLLIFNKFKIRHFDKNERRNWEEVQQKEFDKREFLKRMLEETNEETLLPSPKKMKKEKKKRL